MEKRKNKRISGDVSGRMIFVSNLDIQDLSVAGIRFRCHKRLVPESRVDLVVEKDGLQVKLPGKIVRSILKNLSATASGESTGYEVAVSFDTLSPEKDASLKKLILLVKQA